MRMLNWIALCVAGLLLVACGNKGDLYLPNEELTEEEQLLINQLENEQVLENRLKENTDKQAEEKKKPAKK